MPLLRGGARRAVSTKKKNQYNKIWLWWWKSKLPAANLKLKTKTNQLDKNKKMNLKNKTYQLSGNATNSPDTGNIAAVIVSRVLNACNLRERAAALVDRLRMDCMHVVAHTCRFFSPFLSDNYCTTLFLRKVRRARTRPRGSSCT